MTRKLQLLTLLFVSFSVLSSAAVLPKRAAQEAAPEVDIIPSVSIPSSSSTSVITTPTATPPEVNNDDNGYSYHYPEQDAAYFENEGASGESGAFIKVSMGAQIAIIVCIVLVGISGLVGVIWFYIKKRREWEAAAVRRRTRNARSMIIAAAAQREKNEEEERQRELKEKTRRDSGSTNSSVNSSTEVRVVDVEAGAATKAQSEKSSFDTESITGSKPWWKKLGGQ